jgi:hypothetical protein
MAAFRGQRSGDSSAFRDRAMYVSSHQTDRGSDTDVLQEKERKGSKFLTEIRAGITTFFTMAYIIAVNVGSPRSKHHS